MLTKIGAADSAASWTLALLPGRWTDRLDRVVQTGKGIPMWTGLTVAIAATGPAGRRAAGSGAIAGLAGAAAANGVKPLVHRRRPRSLLHHPSRRTASLPSSHITTGAAFSTAACLVWRPSALVAVPVVAAVGFSRVHSRQHHLGDVAAGAALGIVIGAMVTVTARRALPKRDAERLAP